MATTNIQSQLQNARALHLDGELQKARPIYEKLLALEPNHFDILSLLGALYVQIEIFDKAIELLEKAIQINPHHVESLSNLGAAHSKLHRYDAAIQCYQKAIDLNPRFINAYINYGNLLVETEKLEESIVFFDRVIELDASHVATIIKRADVLRRLKQYDAAKEGYARALNINNQNEIAWASLGLLHKERGDYLKAIQYFQTAIQINPKIANIHNDLAATYNRENETEKAAIHLMKAIELEPNHINAHHNLGATLQGLCQYSEALVEYETVLSLQPGMVNALWNRANCYLALGNYEQAWPEYEIRWNYDDGLKKILENYNFQVPLWLGDADLSGKTIFLFAEQGMGDTLQFCRYVSMVANLGAKVILQVQEPLEELLHSLSGVWQLLLTGQPLPPFDYYCPLMSLPLAFHTRLETIPAAIPYIQASPDKVAHWAQLLGKKARPRIGLVWSSGVRPDRPESIAADSRRNIPIDQIACLQTMPADFYSLQKGNPAEAELLERHQQVWTSSNLFNFTDQIHNFSDTAALIENLDLVISVCTSTPHLAGAMGKPVWIINRFDNCWRWLLDRGDSPWYPTARLYRQSIPRDWTAPLEKLQADLRIFLTKGSL
jgi:tetratricopeptide (TPR) repeat protein